jgi:hypothetical protein
LDKQIWLLLGILSCLFASGFAAAAEDEPGWWIVMMKNEPALCGQTSEGQLLCLHGEGGLREGPGPLKRVGTLAQDWAFLDSGAGPI